MEVTMAEAGYMFILNREVPPFVGEAIPPMPLPMHVVTAVIRAAERTSRCPRNSAVLPLGANGAPGCVLLTVRGAWARQGDTRLCLHHRIDHQCPSAKRSTLRGGLDLSERGSPTT